MKYILTFILICYTSYSDNENNIFIYNEVQGPQKSLISPNLEYKFIEMSNDSLSEQSLRIRGGVTLITLVLFKPQPSYLLSLHYVAGVKKKLDLGIAIVQENYDPNDPGDFFNTATSISFTLGFRHSIGNDWFVGGAICPTYSNENVPFYPVSFKIGFSL